MNNTIPFPAEESGTAKLLRDCLAQETENRIEELASCVEMAQRAKTDKEKARWLKAASDWLNGALVAMGEK